MSAPDPARASLSGAFWAVGAVVLFSMNDVIMKLMSGDYALHQIVLIRALVGMVFLLAVLVPFTGGIAALRTRRLGMHVVRALCVVFANIFFFLGLAALPLAEAVAIFFVSPLFISVASVVFLRETVGPRRWAAIALGLIGVLIVLRPGTEAFRPAAVLPLLTLGLQGGEALLQGTAFAAASLLAPIGYAGLIFGTFWGFVLFGETPDGWTVAGALVIVGAGIYVWHRETRVAKPAIPAT